MSKSNRKERVKKGRIILLIATIFLILSLCLTIIFSFEIADYVGFNWDWDVASEIPTHLLVGFIIGIIFVFISITLYLIGVLVIYATKELLKSDGWGEA